MRTIPKTGKRVPLNMRTTTALRKKIEREASKNGRSLVQEVELRIERSFRDEWLLDEICKMWEARG